MDALSAPLLQQLLTNTLARGRIHVVLDVAKLTFCDSTGVWILAEGHRRASTMGGRLPPAYVHGILQRILEINQQAGYFPFGVDFGTTLEW
ncbi:anti-sigma B factor antagonist [Streptosporangium album]|uniref:Anti-sigma B factor antagonist n=1 Tax=Streptosporangium album TaxID=47479 RepID=A0A7W7S3L1_9ACTN|nr:STAS domain-containing protein [Streptosporangium album]MBB4943281.1 anti-sigma B factor antagonist [Streptosporangium album]